MQVIILHEIAGAVNMRGEVRAVKNDEQGFHQIFGRKMVRDVPVFLRFLDEPAEQFSQIGRFRVFSVLRLGCTDAFLTAE